MSLWLHGKEDFISEAGAMNVWIIKQAQDGCEWSFPAANDPLKLTNRPRVRDHGSGQRHRAARYHP